MTTTTMFLVVALAASAMASPVAFPQRARKASCTTFGTKQQCEEKSDPTDNCEWAGTVPGDFDEANYKCQAPSCMTLNFAPGDVKGECSKTSGCTWNDEVYYCVTTGATPPCELYYADPDAGEKCPSQCTYDAKAYKCITTGQTAPCDSIYDETGCASEGCDWHEDIYKCWEKGKALPCVEYHYMSRDECPATCKFATTSKPDADEETGVCLESTEEVACDEYECGDMDGACCPADHCTYHAEPLYLCWGKDRKIPCEKLPGETCAPDETCKWFKAEDGAGADDAEDGVCGPCPAGEDCKSTWDGPTDGGGGTDTGKDCTSYAGSAVYDCPEPRCYLDFDDAGAPNGGCSAENGEGETCRVAKCTDLDYDEEACNAHKNTAGSSDCKYDDSGVCYDAAAGMQCDHIYDEEVCTAQAQCKFDSDEYICYSTVSGRTCDSFMQSSSCPSDTCKWVQDMDECVDKNKKLSCTAYADEGNCPAADGCEWKQGICWEQNKDIPCGAFCSSYNCEASGSCHFDQDDYQCKLCEGGNCPAQQECSTYKDEMTCPESHCEFAFNEDTQEGSDESGTCVKKVCADIYDKGECVAKEGCSYKESTDGEGEMGQCFPSGYTVPCSMYYEETACTGSCSWDASNYRCNEANSKTPCELFMVEDCPADRCTKSEYECMVDSSKMPSSPPVLNGKGDGTGNEDATKCDPTAYDKVKGALESADSECFVHGRRARRDDKQLECLTYFLQQSGSTVDEACPCLWFWAKSVSPGMDHWMQIAC